MREWDKFSVIASDERSKPVKSSFKSATERFVPSCAISWVASRSFAMTV